MLEQHPLSAVFPVMPEAELGALALDIEAHGQREPGILFEGMVLDGWHRYLACEKVGVQFKSVELNGQDPVAFVISKNLHRRHLTASQRAAAVVAAHNWRPHGDQPRSLPGRYRTMQEMAKEAEVSHGTIEQAKAAHEAGLGGATRDGTLSVKRAAEIAKLPPAKREKALSDPKPPKPKNIDAAKLQAQVEELTARCEHQQEALDALVDTDKTLEAFKDNEQVKEMQILRLELKSCKRRRDELMAENASLKKQVAYLQKKLDKK